VHHPVFAQERLSMNRLNNPFVDRQIELLRQLDRELICLYAETCYQSILFIQGGCTNIDQLDSLMDRVSVTERRFQRQVAALHRVGIHDVATLCLNEAERISWFADCLRGSDRAPVFGDVLHDSDLAALLEDLSRPVYRMLENR
jgi:hypothetical protein